MNTRFILLSLFVGCLCSCSSSHQSQTTDEVSYSNSKDNGSSQVGDGGYLTTDGNDSRVQSNNNNSGSTVDSYNDYAYGGYQPYSTFIDPYWGGGWGMGPALYNPYSVYYGMYGFYPSYGIGASLAFGYGIYPPYYGGYYYPYYPGFGYYGSEGVGTASGVGNPAYNVGRPAALAYNNSHFTSVTNSTVPHGIIGRPVVNSRNSLASMVNIRQNIVRSSTYTSRGNVTNNLHGVPNTGTRTVRQVNTTNSQPSYFRGGGGGSFGGGRMGGGFGGRGH